MLFKLTIDRFEGDLAILISDGGHNIAWPKDKLPPDSREGQVLDFLISPDLPGEESRRRLARDILNEILNTDEKTSP